MRLLRLRSIWAVGALFAVSCASAKPAPMQPAPLDIAPMPSAAAPAQTSAPVAASPPVSRGHCGKSEVGIDAPPLDVQTLDGARTGVTNQHVTVVHFWASWCAPCSQSFPKLQKLWAKNSGRGMDLVAVSVDDEKSSVAPYAKGHAASFPIAWDEGHSAAACWRVATMPTTYIVDRDGVLRFEHDGWRDGQDAIIEREVEWLLRE